MMNSVNPRLTPRQNHSTLRLPSSLRPPSPYLDGMKYCFLVLLFCCGRFSPASAQIHADVQTTKGTFTIELDYSNSPLAVANFIGLATGTKTWIESTTGAAKSNTPYYHGVIFHRVIAGFMNQTGSRKGDGTDGPGYVFPDELSTSDFSQGYRVAMANSGPQTNGSQFFVTVGSSTHLNNLHTVFGSVPPDDGPGGIVDGSRGVIDAINAVLVAGSKPVADVVIQSISLRRMGAAALAFDDSAPPLPEVTGTPMVISFPGGAPSLGFTQAAGSSCVLGLSPDLTGWTTATRYLDATASGPLNALVPGELQDRKDRHFYHASLVRWPGDAVFADSLANKTLTLNTAADPSTPFIFTFDASGITGTWSYPRAVDPLSGAILNTANGTTNGSSFNPTGYGGRLIMSLSGINYSAWSLQIGLDIISSTSLSGRTSGTAHFGSNTLNVGGSFNLTR